MIILTNRVYPFGKGNAGFLRESVGPSNVQTGMGDRERHYVKKVFG
ncbi:MAG: hypothetical protein ACYCQL_10895 [Acidithiobacillus sp.]